MSHYISGVDPWDSPGLPQLGSGLVWKSNGKAISWVFTYKLKSKAGKYHMTSTFFFFLYIYIKQAGRETKYSTTGLQNQALQKVQVSLKILQLCWIVCIDCDSLPYCVQVSHEMKVPLF